MTYHHHHHHHHHHQCTYITHTIILSNTVEPCYNEDLKTIKITLLYQGLKKNPKEISRAGTSKITLL